MLTKYQIWDKISNVYTPSGNMYTAEEWINKYKWINIPGMVPVSDEQVLDAIEAWDEQRAAEAKAAAAEAANTPTTEERIAAALEYQNLLNS